MISVFFRTLIIYIVLVISMRLTGKRQLGELQVTELIVTLMLSELASLPIIDKRAPVSYAILPILLILSLEVIFSFTVSKLPKLKKLIIGTPVIIIKHGRLIQSELLKNRIDICELLSELRLNGVFDISEVAYAILEDNGKLSVIKSEASSPVTPQMAGLTVSETGLAHTVIADGRISDTGLCDAQKTEAWLKRELDAVGASTDDVLLMTVNDIGNVLIIKKEANN